MAARIVATVLGLLLVVGNGRAVGAARCIGLEGVVDSEAALEYGKDGQLRYTNKNSPDYFVLNIIEYSRFSDFRGIPPIDRVELQNLEVADEGTDLDIRRQPPAEGTDIIAGRFVFVKGGDPLQPFDFPQRGRLVNGERYYLRSFRYRPADDCFAPPLNEHDIFPSEVAVQPPWIETLGGPSAPRNLTVIGVEADSLQISWAPPWDAGDGTNGVASGVVAEVRYRLYISSDCVSGGGGGSEVAYEVVKETPAYNITVDGLCTGALHLVNLTAYNLYGESGDVSLLARPISAPGPVSNLQIIFNPNGYPNTTGNLLVKLDWELPADTGDGGDGVDIVSYQVIDMEARPQQVVYEGPESEFLVRGNAYQVQYAYRVIARNSQGPDLGVFSRYGDNATVGPERHEMPASMEVEYFSACAPSCTDPCRNLLRIFTPPHARGGSGLCNGGCGNGSDPCTDAVAPFPADHPTCFEDVQQVCDNPEDPANTCVPCRNPVMAVFVGSPSTFVVVARMHPSSLTAVQPTIVDDPPAADVLGAGAVTLSDASDPAQPDTARYLVNITVPPQALIDEMADGEDPELCFVAETFQGLRSQLCVTIRIIGPKPVFRSLDEDGGGGG
eukprot:CAMPEP_0181295572 /NCGR_PEP_ID=MMETSP1101-20121128/4221_1 /TAXON_ID=46948 /ORGANISM="Rhodomonas abbreviata, Strain Caron Lab Isolate" /LENGTH=612 /DNA_ID=CAMNT_0023400337 /DNA_START=236 /DNA_END=2070 /DNA_ORIENTATION=+